MRKKKELKEMEKIQENIWQRGREKREKSRKFRKSGGDRKGNRERREKKIGERLVKENVRRGRGEWDFGRQEEREKEERKRKWIRDAKMGIRGRER